MKLPMYEWGKKATQQSFEAGDYLFVDKISAAIIARMVRWQLAKRQQGTHKALNMGEVRGTTAKPFRQKKTGRARQGSLRAPHHRGGSVVFGPVVRSHGHDLPRHVKRLANCQRTMRAIIAAEILSTNK